MAGLLDFPELLRGLLGGQGPPQQQPQYQAPQQQGLFPGAGDRSTAAIQNFVSSPTILGGISNAYQGATTGQRTDPAGMFQQMAALTSQLLQRNGVPQAQADLAALDPNAQKAVIGRLFPTYEFKEAGGQGVAFNPYLGTGEPVISMPKGPTQLGPGEVPVFTQPSFPSSRSGAAPAIPLSRMPPVQSQPLPPPPGVPGQASPTPGAPSGPLPGITQPPGAGAVPPAPAAGMNLPPGVTMGGTPMTLQEKEAQIEQGKVQGQTAAKLPTILSNATMMLKQIEEVRSHPGRNFLTQGTPFAALPTAPGSQGRDFVNRVQQITSGSFLASIQDLRGFGALSNREGDKAQAAKSRLDRASSKGEFDAALNDYRDVIRAGVQNAQLIASGKMQPYETTPFAWTSSAAGGTPSTAAPSFTRDEAIAEARKRGLMK